MIMSCPERDFLVMYFRNDSVANPFAKILAESCHYRFTP
jgi:hypothetical protein